MLPILLNSANRLLRCVSLGKAARVLANWIWYVCCAKVGDDPIAVVLCPLLSVFCPRSPFGLSASRSNLTQIAIDGASSAMLPFWCASNKPRSTSPACRKASTISCVRGISFLRTRSSRVSKIWVTSAMSVKPKVPLPPLIEWAARKMAFTWSASGASRSSASNKASILTRCSAASSKNT